MGSRGIENASSLERYLNRSVLFVQGIEPNVPKSEVLQVLSQVCKAPQQGRIDILTTPDGKMRGTAFLNFHNREDAKAALEKWRFKMELRGRQLRMQYSSDREFKDIIQGPLMARFKIVVRNLPEELDQEVLFDMFSEYGEILQFHATRDPYGHHYAIIQYVEVASVQAAVLGADGVRVQSHVLGVEQFKPNHNFGPPPRNTSMGSGAANGPAAPAGAQASGSGAGGGSAGGGLAARLSGGPGQAMTYAALQQQQEAELARQQQEAAASGTENGGTQRTTDTGAREDRTSAGGAGGTTTRGMSLPVPSFYAEAAAGGGAHPTAWSFASMAGSLQSLLATALHHAHMLEELLCCPITQEPLTDPVVAADGNTYERLAIEAWLEHHDTSPLTNQVLVHKSLTPNNLLRKIAEELKGTSGSASVAAEADASAADPDAVGALSDSMAVPIPVPIPHGAVVHHYETLQEAQYSVEQQHHQQHQAQHPSEQQHLHQGQHQQPFDGRHQHHQAQQQQQSSHQHPQQQHQHYHHQAPQQMLPQQQHYMVAQVPQMSHLRAQAQPFAFNVNAPTYFTYRPMM